MNKIPIKNILIYHLAAMHALQHIKQKELAFKEQEMFDIKKACRYGVR